jgi:hypothetical protein
MTKNIQDAFDYFEINAKVLRVALNNEQVKEWNLPDTQLEAIEPDRMITIVQEAVREYIDQERLGEMLEEQRYGQEVVDRWKEEFVDWYSENAPPEEEEA